MGFKDLPCFRSWILSCLGFEGLGVGAAIQATQPCACHGVQDLDSTASLGVSCSIRKAQEAMPPCGQGHHAQCHVVGTCLMAAYDV